MMDDGDGGMGLMGADDALDLEETKMRGNPKFSIFSSASLAAGTSAELFFDWLEKELPSGVALVTDNLHFD
jgi:hypothetical protein